MSRIFVHKKQNTRTRNMLKIKGLPNKRRLTVPRENTENISSDKIQASGRLNKKTGGTAKRRNKNRTEKLSSSAESGRVSLETCFRIKCHPG